MYYGAVFYKDNYFRGSGNTPESCVKEIETKIQEMFKHTFGYKQELKVTFRPADGTIYVNFGNIPCGILFKEGYS